MKSRTTTLATSPRAFPKSARVGVAGPYQWSRESLLTSIASRLRRPIADLGLVDEGLASRVGQKDIAVLVADIAAVEGIRIIESVHHIHPKTKVIALSVPEGNGDVVSLVQSGVTGIVLPNSALDDLIAELRFVLKGAGVCTPRVADMLARHVGRNSSRYIGRSRALSPRETEVARLMAEGLPNKLIADTLNISQGTVKNHIHRILEKMSIQRRTDIPGCLLRVRRQGPVKDSKASGSPPQE